MWKKSEVWKNKKFRLLLVLEVILFLIGIVGLIPGDRIVGDESTMRVAVHGGEYLEEKQGYYIDGSYGYNGEFLTMWPETLRPGVYRLRLVLEASDNEASFFEVKSSTGQFRNLLSNSVNVYGGAGEQTCQFYVCGVEKDAAITVNYSGGEPLLIKKIELVHTNAGSRILICLTLAGALLVNTLFLLFCYMKKYTVPLETKLVWFGIPGLAVLASLPLFVDYMIIGADSIFHWMRIEALAQSIAQGNIPARIEALWLYGHGYANSVFYCDTFLTLPALLRLLGFDMNTAHGTYVFAVNLATAVIAYKCFRGCFQDSRIGMIGSMLYTLAPYRIYNIYNRDALGEYTAMTFLRSYADDLPLLEWLHKQVFPKEALLTQEDVYHLCKLGIMEYLTSGITSNFDMYFAPLPSAKASVDCGFRTVFTSGLNDFCQSLSEVEELYYQIGELSDRTSFYMGFHAEYTTSLKLMEGMSALAAKVKSPVWLHNSETAQEVNECLKRWGKTPTELTDSLGMYAYGGGGYHH